MSIDFVEHDEYMAKTKKGSITIKKLCIENKREIEEAIVLHEKVSITKDNYKKFIGISEYDDFYGFGGKYNPLSYTDIEDLIKNPNAIVLAAFSKTPTYHCCGVVWVKKDDDYFFEKDSFRFKPEYAGVRNLFEKHVTKGDIVVGPDTAHIAPVDFPEIAIALNYAMISYCLSRGITASAYELYKNISCADAEGIHYLDTFDYNAYNAYKIMGYDHVGYMKNKDFSINDEITITTEPQIIAGLDFKVQAQILEKLLEKNEVQFL